MALKSTFFLTLFISSLTFIHGYSDCGSTTGQVITVNVANCDNSQRCVLKRNTNASLEIEFTSNTDSDSIKAVVHGVILDVPMPFDLPNPDGCKDSGIACPIKSGEKYKYTAVLPVSGSYPRVTVDVKWELKDKDGKDIVCVLIPSKIK